MRTFVAAALFTCALCTGTLSARADGAAAAPAAQAATSWNVSVKDSSVTYYMVHKMHKFQGTSRQLEGKAMMVPGKAQVMVRAPVGSFDSANGNRDAHMKEVVEAARYPQVELKAASDLALPATFPATVDKTFKAELSFHGVKKVLDVPVHLVFESANKVRATTKLTVSLDEHKIERPSLLFVKVDDAMGIDVDVVFTR